MIPHDGQLTGIGAEVAAEHESVPERGIPVLFGNLGLYDYPNDTVKQCPCNEGTSCCSHATSKDNVKENEGKAYFPNKDEPHE